MSTMVVHQVPVRLGVASAEQLVEAVDNEHDDAGVGHRLDQTTVSPDHSVGDRRRQQGNENARLLRECVRDGLLPAREVLDHRVQMAREDTELPGTSRRHFGVVAAVLDALQRRADRSQRIDKRTRPGHREEGQRDHDDRREKNVAANVVADRSVDLGAFLLGEDHPVELLGLERLVGGVHLFTQVARV